MYWGPQRYRTPLLRGVAKALDAVRRTPRFEGEDQASPFFWGDLCKEHIRFVRGFAFARMDTHTLPPGRPYREPSTPWVNYWFTTSDCPDVHHFTRLVTAEAIESLARDGGVCILSTHLGKGFVRDNAVDPRVEATLTHLAELPGWFVPVSDILEHLLAGSTGNITRAERLQLELAHVLDRVIQRIASRRRVCAS